MQVQNLTTGQTITAGQMALSYNGGTNTAMITFPGVTSNHSIPTILPDGNYRVTLLSAGINDGANPLDGNGDGVGGDNYINNTVFVWAGDANRDRVVDVRDLHIVLGNREQSDQLFTDGDFNYDGMVDKFDLRIVARNMNNSVPPPSAILPRRGPNRIAEALLA